MDTNNITEKARDWEDKAQEMGDQARETAEQAGSTARRWAEKARTRAREFGGTADLYVHEHAWTTLALVALTAGTLGYLLGSRRR